MGGDDARDRPHLPVHLARSLQLDSRALVLHLDHAALRRLHCAQAQYQGTQNDDGQHVLWGVGDSGDLHTVTESTDGPGDVELARVLNGKGTRPTSRLFVCPI